MTSIRHIMIKPFPIEEDHKNMAFLRQREETEGIRIPVT